MRRVRISRESWPIAGRFTIARGTKTQADVVVISIEEDGRIGQGECVPYSRYGECVESVVAALETARSAVEAGASRFDVPVLVEPKAGRNALDCALWDLESKLTGTPVWKLAGLSEPVPLITAFTIGLGAPAEMADAAARNADRPLLKVKLGGGSDDAERLREIRKVAPQPRLIIDANEGWKAEEIDDMFALCADMRVDLVEQPLPAGDDEPLRVVSRRGVLVCADEAAHDRTSLSELEGKYDAVNIKLDKTGGLTEALAMKQAAIDQGFSIMVGCMLSTSLAMAPAMLVAESANVVDLDGPLLLAKDREHGIRFEGSLMHPPLPELWG